MTFYVDGLLPTIREHVSHYREEQPRRSMDFQRLAAHTRALDGSTRAQAHAINNPYIGGRNYQPTRIRPSSPVPRGRQEDVNLLDGTGGPVFSQDPVEDPVKLEHDMVQPAPIAYQVIAEEMFYIDNHRQQRRMPPRIPYDSDRSRRVGWVDQQRLTIICHACYEQGHISPQCKLRLLELDNVIANYEKLSADDRTRVPRQAYDTARAYLNVKKAADAAKDEEATSTAGDSKN